MFPFVNLMATGMLGLLWQKSGMTVEFPGATGNVVLNKTAVLAAEDVEECL